MKKYTLFFIIFLLFAYGYGQNFEKYLGGSGSDELYSIQETKDGGYICAGTTTSNDGDVTENHGNYDLWVVKLTDTGNIQWQKSLGGSNGEYASSIMQTTDGGYICLGTSTSNDGDVSGNHGDSDYWIVKLTKTGNIQWQKSLGGTNSEAANSIQQTADGGYIVGGFSGSNDGDVSGNHGGHDSWIVKLTKKGRIQWQKTLGGSSLDGPVSVWQTTDKGYICAGYTISNDGDVTENHGSSDLWVVKLTNTGSMQWQKSLGGTNAEFGNSIQQTTDGGYIITGGSFSNDGDVTENHGSSDTWVVKLTDTGSIQWQKSFGNAFPQYESLIRQTVDGGYVVAIDTDPDSNDDNSNNDLWVIKLSNTGTILQEQTYGTFEGYDVAKSIRPTTDGGYLIAGYSNSNVGNGGSHGYLDGWVIKTGSILSTYESTLENLFRIYPNPTDNEIHIISTEYILDLPYIIYDQSGKSVMKGKLSDYNGIIKIDNLSKGIYILSIGDKIKTNRKFIKQ